MFQIGHSYLIQELQGIELLSWFSSLFQKGKCIYYFLTDTECRNWYFSLEPLSYIFLRHFQKMIWAKAETIWLMLRGKGCLRAVYSSPFPFSVCFCQLPLRKRRTQLPRLWVHHLCGFRPILLLVLTFPLFSSKCSVTCHQMSDKYVSIYIIHNKMQPIINSFPD